MKHLSLIRTFVLIAGASFSFYACRDQFKDADKSPDNSSQLFNPVTIQEAKQFVADEGLTLKAKGGRKDQRTSDAFSKIKPLWDKAYESSSPEGSFLVVPTTSQPFINVVEDESGKSVERYCPPLALIVYRDKSSRKQARYVTSFSDKPSGIEFPNLSTYSGRVVYYDLDGQVVVTKYYKEGKRMATASEVAKSGRTGVFCKQKWNCRYSGYDPNEAPNPDGPHIYARWIETETICTASFYDNVVLRQYDLMDSELIMVCDISAPEQQPQPYPMGASGGAPGGPSNNSIDGQLYNQPWALYSETDVPCPTIQKWINLAKHKVTGAIKDKVTSLSYAPDHRLGTMSTNVAVSPPYVAYTLDIDNAYSAVVNMDYFEVTITKLPQLYGHQSTAPELLDYIRRNVIGELGQCTFVPYQNNGVDDTSLWNSANPYGTIINITIPGNSGSVICSSYSADQWIFSTIAEPFNGLHPVSGNRQFGYETKADGTYAFYIRGVDRITDPFTTMVQSSIGVPFSKADGTWQDWQSKVNELVTNNGGRSTIRPKIIYRPDWQRVKEVRDGVRPLSDLQNGCN